jgi:hypothetical protein
MAILEWHTGWLGLFRNANELKWQALTEVPRYFFLGWATGAGRNWWMGKYDWTRGHPKQVKGICAGVWRLQASDFVICMLFPRSIAVLCALMALRCWIFSDSICRFIYLPKHANVQALSGATVDKLITRVQENVINIPRFDLMIIHVGTNDVDNRRDPNSILCSMQELVQEIIDRNHAKKNCYQCILPRPKDILQTRVGFLPGRKVFLPYHG